MKIIKEKQILLPIFNIGLLTHTKIDILMMLVTFCVCGFVEFRVKFLRNFMHAFLFTGQNGIKKTEF